MMLGLQVQLPGLPGLAPRGNQAGCSSSPRCPAQITNRNALQISSNPTERIIHSSNRRWVACATAPAAPLAQQTGLDQPWQQQEDLSMHPTYSSSSQQPDEVAAFDGRPDFSYTKPSIGDTGTLRPPAEWYPAWMQYRRREDNYVFWQDKFVRCSLDIPWYEKRWTLFSSLWFLVVEAKFFAIPPALRFLWHLAWRNMMTAVYTAHKFVVLSQCVLDSWVAREGSGGEVDTFSKAMALRRLHWKNSLLGEVLYLVNVFKTGRIHMLPPTKRPMQRPTFFFLF